MFLAIIIKLLLLLGAGFVAAVVVKLVKLTFMFLITRARDKLRKGPGRTVLAIHISKLIRDLRQEAENNGNIHKIDELIAELGEDGAIIADADENYNVKPEDIDIYSAESIDDRMADYMQRNNGELVLV